MTIQTTACDLLILAMKNKLKQVYRRGEYEVLMVYSDQAYYNRMLVYVYVDGGRVMLGELTFDELPTANMAWGDLGDLVHVNDEMRTRLMLLFHDM